MHTIAHSEQAALLALSDERDQWQARIFQFGREEYERGHRDGFDAGRRWQQADDAARQRQAADHILPAATSTGFRALQIKRWAPPGWRWRGRIPPDLTSSEERIWLARLPRRGDYRPQP